MDSVPSRTDSHDALNINNSSPETDSNSVTDNPQTTDHSTNITSHRVIETPDANSNSSTLIDIQRNLDHDDINIDVSSTNTTTNTLYSTKRVNFNGSDRFIVTQNENGPCPMIAIANVLILRDQLKVHSSNSNSSGIREDRLIASLADVLMSQSPETSDPGELSNYELTVNDAFKLFPALSTGLDVNVQFGNISAFEYTPALGLFDLFKIPLYHGWLTDPDDSWFAFAKSLTYNQLVELVIDCKASTDSEQVNKGLLLESFLDETASQLTPYGIQLLRWSIPDNQLAVLFRNNHFSTILKRNDKIYILMTDMGLLGESKVVWEELVNVDGDNQFVDSHFKPYKPSSQSPCLTASQPSSGTRSGTNTHPELSGVCSQQMLDQALNSESANSDLQMAVMMQLNELDIAEEESTPSPATAPIDPSTGPSDSVRLPSGSGEGEVGQSWESYDLPSTTNIAPPPLDPTAFETSSPYRRRRPRHIPSSSRSNTAYLGTGSGHRLKSECSSLGRRALIGRSTRHLTTAAGRSMTLFVNRRNSSSTISQDPPSAANVGLAAATQTSPTSELISEMLAGQRYALSKAITLIESDRLDKRAEGQKIIDAAMHYLAESKRSTFRIGLSGPPGAGKSTFIEALGTRLTGSIEWPPLESGEESPPPPDSLTGKQVPSTTSSSGERRELDDDEDLEQELHRQAARSAFRDPHKVAVLAVDPSSRTTGGSLLADKTRMGELCCDPSAYIRPSPSGDHLGGVARSTNEAVVLCEAAGFDIVLVETVGVGQSEFVVNDMVDLFVLILPPAGGDELQGIKRGIVEVADVVLINKADGNLLIPARHIANEYKNALHYHRPKRRNWRPPVMLVSSRMGTGLSDFWLQALEFKFRHLASNELQETRLRQQTVWMWSYLKQHVWRHFRQHPSVSQQIKGVELKVKQGQMSPGAAAELLAKQFYASV